MARIAFNVRTAGAPWLGAPVLALNAAMASAAPAPLPTGGRVTAGSAVIGAPSGGQITINQSSGRAVLTWSDFSIAAGNGVQFNNGAGATLNRVTTANPSLINGALNVTGSVYLINPNGIVTARAAWSTSAAASSPRRLRPPTAPSWPAGP